MLSMLVDIVISNDSETETLEDKKGAKGKDTVTTPKDASKPPDSKEEETHEELSSDDKGMKKNQPTKTLVIWMTKMTKRRMNCLKIGSDEGQP